ncbi:alpha/beta fold hydrolase [Ornithinibacillus xuwenensis]|uniref:Alpha/beta hydrolase n=1 Tax=Ornithinibacillus xuwenensis TaxID=3144668 RepID=A0ABU9XEX4_9BACI
MKFVTSDGTELFIEKAGKGVPCIYLHGGPGYWSKSIQQYAGPLLEQDLELLYADQRGCGRSSLATNKDYSLERLRLDIEEIRNYYQIDKWYLMGHSFGGILAVNYAYQYPDNVEGIILSNATLNMIDSFQQQIQKGREFLQLDDIDIPTDDIATLTEIYFDTVQELMAKELFSKLQFKDTSDKEKLDDVDQELDAKPDFQQSVFSSGEFFQDFTSLTSAITKPVLVMSGSHDFAVGPTHQESFQFPNAIYKQFDGGHHPYVDQQDNFQKAIRNFIQLHS